MASSMNPMHYLRNAWNATHSGWGKFCLITFYVFIWFQILSGIATIAWPAAGFECFYDGMSEYQAATMHVAVRVLNVFAIGFFLYADRGGIQVWNVSMVFVVYLVWTVFMMNFYNHYLQFGGAPQGCWDAVQTIKVSMWVFIIWPFVSLVSSIMESRSAPSASAGESEPLNV